MSDLHVQLQEMGEYEIGREHYRTGGYTPMYTGKAKQAYDAGRADARSEDEGGRCEAEWEALQTQGAESHDQ